MGCTSGSPGRLRKHRAHSRASTSHPGTEPEEGVERSQEIHPRHLPDLLLGWRIPELSRNSCSTAPHQGGAREAKTGSETPASGSVAGPRVLPATPLPVPPRGSHVGRQAAGRGIFLPGSRGAGWGGTPHFRMVPWERLVYQHGEARAGLPPLVHSPNVPSGQARLGLKPELNPGLPHEWSGPKLAGRRRPPKVRT